MPSRALALIPLPLLLFAGCAVSPLATRVASFGSAATTVTKGAFLTYDMVEQTAYNSQVASLVLNFDTKGFDPDKIKLFLTGEDLEARQLLLRTMQRYAALLQDVAGNQPIDRLNTQVAAFGRELGSLTSNPTLTPVTNSVGAPQMRALTTALDALGQFIIERKRHTALPPILNKMQDVIDHICAILNADLGNRPNSDGIGGRGLRNQLWLEYDRLIEAQKVFIDRNKISLAPLEKANEIGKLPTLVKEQRAADSALAATQTALDDLAKTHRALLSDPKTDTSFTSRLNELLDDGQRITNFYTSLRNK